ncbi:MAG: ABC transporter ATP-binding protein [Chloroflexota bacterium]|nr:ABC transporter ATP-binding protein [Chloroflexota bacterium]MDE2918855.1 ABC transporter ATP-binding protein [Chloroflexota bacterium]
MVWLVSAAMDLIVPQVLQRVIDEGIVAGDRSRLVALSLLAAALIVLRGAALFGARFCQRWYQAGISRQLRNEVYDKLQRLPYAYYDRVDSGDVITLAISDTRTVQGFTGYGVMEAVRTVGIYVVIVTGMVIASAQLTLMALIVLALMVAVATVYGRVVRPMWLAYRSQQAQLTRVLTENLNGIRVVKAFATEEREIEAFGTESELMRERALAPIRLRARAMPLMLLLTGIGSLVVIWAGGLLAIDGSISVGVLLAFYYYFTRLIQPSRRLGFIVQQVARTAVSADRVFGLLDEPVGIESPPDAAKQTSVKGRVDYDGVDIAFNRRAVVSGVSAAVGAGDIVGVVGPTGSGKTSLLNLIARYYDAAGGAVRVDGQDVRSFDLGSLRSAVSIVPQDPFLFSDTVRNNIAYGNPDASLDDVIAAAKDAQAYDFILGMPEGFETVIGERGVGLSGGQRQRLTIARALLRESAILILDDATSSVDTETERRIQDALRRRAGGRTTFIVSQRISSVEHADEILVVDDGRVADRGTHAELLSRPGFYRDLFDLQVRQAEEARADLAAAEAADA